MPAKILSAFGQKMRALRSRAWKTRRSQSSTGAVCSLVVCNEVETKVESFRVSHFIDTEGLDALFLWEPTKESTSVLASQSSYFSADHPRSRTSIR